MPPAPEGDIERLAGCQILYIGRGRAPGDPGGPWRRSPPATAASSAQLPCALSEQTNSVTSLATRTAATGTRAACLMSGLGSERLAPAARRGGATQQRGIRAQGRRVRSLSFDAPVGADAGRCEVAAATRSSR